MTCTLKAFIARRWSVPESCLEVEVQPLHGGLVSPVARARISTRGRTPGVPPDVVVKHLSGESAREADVYEVLWRHLAQPPAVQMYGRAVSGDTTHLYLEHASACSPWPWRDSARAARVCRELAQLHDSPGLRRDIFAWNYEDLLTRSAEDTLELAALARDVSGQRVWRRLGDLRRVVKALPHIRARLLAGELTVIHGDVHPGNVILRAAGTDDEVVLIDWGRARVASPLEDVASWLHSLGCWEPQARRRHDTLMRAYLDARAVPRPFDSRLRVEYAFAALSNGLSGAIRYHLAVLVDPATAETVREHSGRALAAWARVVRHASALVSTNLDR